MEALTPSTTPKQYPASKPCTSALQDTASSFPSSLSGLSGDGGIPAFTMEYALSASAFTMASALLLALLLAKAEPAVRANSKAKPKIGVRERFISSPPDLGKITVCELRESAGTRRNSTSAAKLDQQGAKPLTNRE